MTDEYEVWTAFLRAHEQRQNLYDISGEFGYFEYDQSIFEYPVSDGLRSLLVRAKQLSDEFEQYEREIDEFYQEAAWAYAAAAFGLHRGDQIRVTQDGKPVIIYCDLVYANSPEREAFEVTGRIGKKDGSAGKRMTCVFLARKDWEIVGRAPRDDRAV
jgi:hypothetical protein